MLQKITKLLCLSLMLAGCISPIDIDVPEYDKKPVVNCFFNNKEPFRIHISLPAGQLDTSLIDVDNAQVKILTNEEVLGDLSSMGEGYYCDSNLIPEIGILYKLSVKIPNYDEIVAIDSIPLHFVEFSFLEYTEKAWYGDEGTEYGGFTFQLDNCLGVNNYEVIYRAKYQVTKNHIGYDSIYDVLHFGYFSCFDYLQEEGIWKSLFNDQLLSIGTNKITLYDNNLDFYLNKDLLDYRVQVIEGSPAYYLYQLTGLRHINAQYSDFWDPVEPIVMFSNIENGYGIFAGYQSKIYKIDL